MADSQHGISDVRFVSYDLRAIHSFIFRVPRLKYIVGGSAMVDRFDRTITGQLEDVAAGVTRISAGGGKGCFRCDSQAAADRLMPKLVASAHDMGMDIRIGCEDTFEAASKGADMLFSYVPTDHDGEPCAMSGLFPVSGGNGIHESIQRRVTQIEPGQPMHRHFERRLGDAAGYLAALMGTSWRFLSHVAGDAEIDAEGIAGLNALGGRSRWAIIYMDGNDMGRQFEAARRPGGHFDEAWVAAMSRKLDQCSMRAVIRGFETVVSKWHSQLDDSQRAACMVDGDTIVPFRPLVVGGDDIVAICHPRHAFDFVRAACDAWCTTSHTHEGDFTPEQLWPATGGHTTVSAGVLFCPASMPLHAAVPYAETLLASAKQRGRAAPPAQNQPSPACIDWECVTESVLDHPAHRRMRELEFIDGDDGGARIRLTRRPYTLEDFEALRAPLTDKKSWLSKLPRSIRSQVLPALRQAKNDRMLEAMSLRQRHADLAEIIEGRGTGVWAWAIDNDARSVGLPDAISILDESSRAGDAEGGAA